jgi:hypothetical protein
MKLETQRIQLNAGLEKNMEKIREFDGTPGRRLTTYATYDRPHLRPQKFKFFL